MSFRVKIKEISVISESRSWEGELDKGNPFYEFAEFLYQIPHSKLLFGSYNMALFDEMIKLEPEKTVVKYERETDMRSRFREILSTDKIYGDQNWGGNIFTKPEDKEQPVVAIRRE